MLSFLFVVAVGWRLGKVVRNGLLLALLAFVTGIAGVIVGAVGVSLLLSDVPLGDALANGINGMLPLLFWAYIAAFWSRSRSRKAISPA